MCVDPLDSASNYCLGYSMSTHSSLNLPKLAAFCSVNSLTIFDVKNFHVNRNILPTFLIATLSQSSGYGTKTNIVTFNNIVVGQAKLVCELNHVGVD